MTDVTPDQMCINGCGLWIWVELMLSMYRKKNTSLFFLCFLAYHGGYVIYSTFNFIPFFVCFSYKNKALDLFMGLQHA